MIGTVGDLVEDIAVRLLAAVNLASDTEAVIRRRRGGSAANTAAAVAALGHPARFIGQIGADAVGDMLAGVLQAAGVDTVVRRGGRTGTIVVLVDAAGERTMLTDRGACADLVDPLETWLDGLTTLHVPYYSLASEPLANTSRTLIGWARQRGLLISIDASSSAVIRSLGVPTVMADLAALAPDLLLCNEDELDALGGEQAAAAVARTALIVKHGADPTTVIRSDGHRAVVPVPPMAEVRDTTGAGDAFTAGLLVAITGGAPLVKAVQAGHASAQAAIRAVSRVD